MKRAVQIIAALTVTVVACMGQDTLDGFVARMYQSPSGGTVPYRLFIPKGYEKRKAYPLVIWLHGSEAVGTDNMKQLEGDQLPGTRAWISPANQKQHPAFVLVPQTPDCWDLTGYSSPLRCRVFPSGGKPGPELELVAELLKSLEKEFSIDTKRVYISGQSLGGYGTWNFVTKKPDLFAAAVPLCGGGDPALAARAKDVPIWSFQGDADSRHILESNRAMIDALRKAGAKPRYTEYVGAGHDIWDRVFREPALVDWVFAQHK